MTQKQSKNPSGPSRQKATRSKKSSSEKTSGEAGTSSPIEIRHPDPEKQKIIDRTIHAGHAAVFRWWQEISDAGKNRLLEQLSQIDFDELKELYESRSEKEENFSRVGIEPVDVISFPKNRDEIEAFEEARRLGTNALGRGEVAALVVAGGQATRLGVDVPKGTLEITPVKKKTIFEHHVEKIRAVSGRYGKRLPFYVMTSETNDRPTRDFFEKNGYFGLDPRDVFFFRQEMMPALDFEGKLMLDAKDHVFTSPNGHGGSITSLKHSGALADMQERGIRYIFYFQVDNVLIKMADPVFLGYHIKEHAEMSAKVAPKRNPGEKVGVLCRAGGEDHGHRVQRPSGRPQIRRLRGRLPQIFGR